MSHVQPVRYNREFLLSLKDKPTVPCNEKAIVQRLKYLRLDKNSALQNSVLKNKNKLPPENNTKGQTLLVPQSAGPKLGRNTEIQGKLNAFDNAENIDPQITTPILKKQVLYVSKSINTPVKLLNEVKPSSIPELPTPNIVVSTPTVDTLSLTPSVETLPVTPSSNIFQTPIKSSSPTTSSPSPSSPSSASKIETDPHRLKQRQKQIDYGYRTIGYIRYSLQVEKEQRDKDHPKTPRKSQTCSKRSWDGQVKKWRRELHKWDPKDSTEFDHLMSDEILNLVYGNHEEMPIIVAQLKEQIAEFMRTGQMGKLSDNPYLLDDIATPLSNISVPSSTERSLQNTSDCRDCRDCRSPELQKPPTVRMLVF